MSDRFFQIHGERPDLIEVGTEEGGLRLTGYVAALTDQGAVRGPQHIFVNRRVVKDRTIGHAVSQAYADATIKERSPEVHLFLEVPSARVDVNVHPTKAEVRFLDQSLVHEVVRRGVSDALGGGRTPDFRVRPAGLAAEPAARTLPDVLASGTFTSRWAATTAAVARSNVPGGAAPTPRPVADGSPTPADSAMSGAEIRPMIPLGQFRDTFIIAIDDEGISIIDQHVAHERVLFEQIMDRLTAERMESQRLLVPIVLQLPAPQREGLAAHADDLGRFGFEIDLFGGDSVRLVATPAVLDQASIETVVRTLAEDLEGLDRGLSVEDRLKRIAATTACHAAVKANDPLTMEQMAHILSELRRTAYSSVCPHGRPVVLRLTRREIEKNFQRI
jgi:DNA mismatch repair protein MutL